MYKIQIEAPADGADKDVVNALHAVAVALNTGDVSEVVTGPENSYSLTVHVLPDKEKE